jgi:hypothetical protein
MTTPVTPRRITDPTQHIRPNVREYASALTLGELAELKKRECKASDNTEDCLGTLRRAAGGVARPSLFEISETRAFATDIPVLNCVEKEAVRNLGPAALVKRIPTECRTTLSGSADQLVNFTFYNSLIEHLRAQPAMTDGRISIPLIETVRYNKDTGGPETLQANRLIVEKSLWSILFGQPAPTTELPLSVAGFIAHLFQNQGVFTPDQRIATLYVAKQATQVLADPAFASLREYFRNPGVPIPIDTFQITSFDNLVRLPAFIIFGNTLVRNRLMSRGWTKIQSENLFVVNTALTVADVVALQDIILQGLFNYMDRRDYDMFRFLIQLFRALDARRIQLEVAAAAAAAASTGPPSAAVPLPPSFWAFQQTPFFLIFRSAALIFFTANFDKRYVRGLWTLKVPDWTSWKTCVESCYRLGFDFPELVRISRSYTLSNPLQSSETEDNDAFAEPPPSTTSGTPGTTENFLEQANKPTLREFLQQIQKEVLYTIVH